MFSRCRLGAQIWQLAVASSACKGSGSERPWTRPAAPFAQKEGKGSARPSFSSAHNNPRSSPDRTSLPTRRLRNCVGRTITHQHVPPRPRRANKAASSRNLWRTMC